MRRSAPVRQIPPPLELECLKALWALGRGTVKDVQVFLDQNRHLAYTTVMTVLDRLAKRGAADRRKVGRSYLYTPRAEKAELRRQAVQELVDLWFEGSREQLLAFLRQEQAPDNAWSARSETRPAGTEEIDTELL